MQVTKRDGCLEEISFDKVLARLKVLSKGLPGVDPVESAQATISGIFDGVETSSIDTLSAQVAAARAIRHPDYGLFAGRISVSNLQKSCPSTFAEYVQSMRWVLKDSLCIFADNHVAEIQEIIKPERDFMFDFFGIETLKKSYLLRDSKGRIVETPQYLYMRLAIAISGESMKSVAGTYYLLSCHFYTHASPTMFHAGLRKNGQLASCFLAQIPSDTIEGIFDTVKQTALISKGAGGIGLAVSNLRAEGSKIGDTGGRASGLVPVLRIFNNTARYVDQGGNKRKGAFAIYVEPWHSDIEAVLELRKNTGAEENRARDLFYALWVPDIFMRRVEKDENWSLFCPNEINCDLTSVWGLEFENNYIRCEREGLYRKQIKARDLWSTIMRCQIETGLPYVLYKDRCNALSNQRHLGTIKNSNLCAEIIQYNSPDETAVCNLASLNLTRFVNEQTKEFDFVMLRTVTSAAIRNLDNVIDASVYPTPETECSNKLHRPVGLGVQGLADVFMLLEIPFESKEASVLNEAIFREMYYASCCTSAELAQERGAHSSFKGSPASKGQFQFDLWKKPHNHERWDDLRRTMVLTGLRNSLLIALMPTASSSILLSNHESFEPQNSNILVRRTMAGEFTCVNRHLVRSLEKLGLWTEEVRAQLIRDNGSVQNIPSLPEKLKAVYKTVWEIGGRVQLNLSAERGPYICQSQSLNAHLVDVTEKKLSSYHFYGWKLGLKTGQYYLRTQAATRALGPGCNGDVCIACSS